MNYRIALLMVLYLPYAVFSLRVIAAEGFGGLLSLVLREKWAMQMILDCLLLYAVFCAWLIPDARKRGITAWPYVVGVMCLGSLMTIPYLIHRELVGLRSPSDPSRSPDPPSRT